MCDIVVDVQVLMFASGSDSEELAEHAQLALEVIKNNHIDLAVDEGELILSQYQNKMSPGAVGLMWVSFMINRGLISFVPRASINRSVRVHLQEKGFNCSGEDYNYYVRTTASTVSKRLITRDNDYTERVCRSLKKKLDILVLSAGEFADEHKNR